MILYYSPGACSLAAHIALHEAGADFEARRVLATQGETRTAGYLAMNPKGVVPVLIDANTVVTESPAILYHIAARCPERGLMPTDLSGRVRVMEQLAFCASTVHPAFRQIFRPDRYATPGPCADEVKANGRDKLTGYLGQIEATLHKTPWFAGERFSFADTYPFVFYRWARRAGLPIDELTAWRAHTMLMLARPSVASALATEGLTASEWATQ